MSEGGETVNRRPAGPDQDQAPVEFLTALLRIPAAAAAQIRARTPSRSRPRPQAGPTADYGTPDCS